MGRQFQSQSVMVGDITHRTFFSRHGEAPLCFTRFAQNMDCDRLSAEVEAGFILITRWQC